MNKNDRLYSIKSNLISRFSGVAISLVIIVYAALIRSGVVHSAKEIDNFGFYGLLFWWVAIAIVQIFSKNKNNRPVWLFLVTYHILFGSFMVFISGMSAPIIASWGVLAVFSYINAKNTGLILSILMFTSFIFMDISIWYRNSMALTIQDVIIFFFTVVTSIVIVMIFQTQEISKNKLEKSKAKEILQRDRILTIVNNLTDAILSTDTKGVIKMYNAACLNLLDTNTSLNGKHIDDVLPLFNQDNKKISLIKELKTTKIAVKRDDLEYRYDKNEKIRLELTLSPIRSNYSHSKSKELHDGYIIIFRDVTKAKSLEEERDEFISVTSHELRTPIAIAEGTLSNMALMVGHPNATTEMLKDIVQTAHDQVMFLANMVNDLSTLSRAERGVADKTEIIDVEELAHKMYDKYNTEAKEKNLHLNLDLSPRLGSIKVSRLYIEELLQNFMTNSLKYTKEGSIDIRFTNKNNIINFAVKDTGIGMSKSDQVKIFNKFYRSEDYRTRETGGTGLGLYIAMKLSKKIGTKIDIISRLNHGSTFSFELPEFEEPKNT